MRDWYILFLTGSSRDLLRYPVAIGILLTMITLFPGQGCAQSQDNDTVVALELDSLWLKVALNSKAVKIKDLEVSAHREAVKDAISSKLPDIGIDGEYARLSSLPQFENGIFHAPNYFPIANSSYSLGASVYFNLYQGGRTGLREAREKAAVKLSERQRELTIAEVKLLATAYYLDLLRGRAFESLLIRNIAEQQKVLAQIRTIYQNGVVLKSDVLRAELKLSERQLQLKQVRTDNLIASQKLSTLSCLPEDVIFEPRQPFLPDTVQLPPYEGLLSKAKLGAYTLRISAEQQRINEVRLKEVRSNILPRLDLFANYAYSYPQGRFYPYSLSVYGLGAAGLHASLPVSELFKNKHRVNMAKLEIEKTRTQSLDDEDQIKDDLKAAWLKFQEEQDRIKVAGGNIKQATENLRIIRNSYLNQTSLVTDYLDADVQLLQANFELTTARIVAQLRYYQLLKILGAL